MTDKLLPSGQEIPEVGRAGGINGLQEATSKKSDQLENLEGNGGLAGAGVAEHLGTRQEGTARTRVSLSGYDVEGLSVGGQETCVILPYFRVAFDSGRCPQRAVYMDTLLLTHTHLDHVGGTGSLVAMRSMLRLSPPTIAVPQSSVDALGRYLDALRELDRSSMPCRLTGLRPGDGFPLNKRAKYTVRAFATSHVVPCQGYCIWLHKNKLRPEFASLSNLEIRDKRLAGEVVTMEVESPEVAFTGDTRIDFVDNPANAEVLKAKLLIMECTFVDDTVTVESAREFGHTHILEIASRADKLADAGHILLIHFSPRYKASYILESLDRELPPKLRAKVTPLLTGF